MFFLFCLRTTLLLRMYIFLARIDNKRTYTPKRNFQKQQTGTIRQNYESERECSRAASKHRFGSFGCPSRNSLWTAREWYSVLIQYFTENGENDHERNDSSGLHCPVDDLLIMDRTDQGQAVSGSDIQRDERRIPWSWRKSQSSLASLRHSHQHYLDLQSHWQPSETEG